MATTPESKKLATDTTKETPTEKGTKYKYVLLSPQIVEISEDQKLSFEFNQVQIITSEQIKDSELLQSMIAKGYLKAI
jgi:hypothetical protein